VVVVREVKLDDFLKKDVGKKKKAATCFLPLAILWLLSWFRPAHCSPGSVCSDSRLGRMLLLKSYSVCIKIPLLSCLLLLVWSR